MDAQGVLGEFHFGHGRGLLSLLLDKRGTCFPAAMMTPSYPRRIASVGLIHRSAWKVNSPKFGTPLVSRCVLCHGAHTFPSRRNKLQLLRATWTSRKRARPLPALPS